MRGSQQVYSQHQAELEYQSAEAVLHKQLDSVVLRVFSNLNNNSVILSIIRASLKFDNCKNGCFSSFT